MENSQSKSVAVLAQTQRLIEQLDALEPSKSQIRLELFQRLYPGIERALARKVSQKKLVEELKELGLDVSIGGFRAMLDAERVRLQHDLVNESIQETASAEQSLTKKEFRHQPERPTDAHPSPISLEAGKTDN